MRPRTRIGAQGFIHGIADQKDHGDIPGTPDPFLGQEERILVDEVMVNCDRRFKSQGVKRHASSGVSKKEFQYSGKLGISADNGAQSFFHTQKPYSAEARRATASCLFAQPIQL